MRRKIQIQKKKYFRKRQFDSEEIIYEFVTKRDAIAEDISTNAKASDFVQG